MAGDAVTPQAQIAAWCDEIERLEKAATPGPWEAEYSPADRLLDVPEFCHVNGWTDKGDGDVLNLARGDAEFIAAARTQIPAMLAAMREMAGALGRARAQAETVLGQSEFFGMVSDIGIDAAYSIQEIDCALAAAAQHAKGVE